MAIKRKVGRPKGVKSKSALTSSVNVRPPTEGSTFSPKMQKFADEYLIDFNGTRAAIAASYSPKSAPGRAYHLLKNPQVREYLRTRVKRISNKTEVTTEKVLREIAAVAFSSLGMFTEFDEDGGIRFKMSDKDIASGQAHRNLSVLAQLEQDTYTEGRGETAQIVKRTKIKLLDKMKALDMLGRYLSLFDGAGSLEDPVTTAQKIGAALREMVKNDKG